MSSPKATPLTSVKNFSSLTRCFSVRAPFMIPASKVHASSWQASLEATGQESSWMAMSSCDRNVQ